MNLKFWQTEKRQLTRESVYGSNFLSLIGLSNSSNAVNIESALGVPAIWAAVQFLSGTMAGLPIDLYRQKKDGRVKLDNKTRNILNGSVNDEMSSFEWRKYIFEQVLTGGRGLTFIERNQAGQIMNLWPLDPTCVTIERIGGKKRYKYKDGSGTKVYQSYEVIDIPYSLKADMLTARSPIMTNKDVVSKAISSTKYSTKLMDNGGVPPFALTGPFASAESMKRASKDLTESVRRGAENDEVALPIPAGHELKPIGVDPEKMQLTDSQKFVITEIARIYNLPPTFLQDLSYGTFSNTEQQDLQLVKHTLRRWVKQAEQEMNLKLFGRNSKLFIKFNIDGLLRGDIKTRYEAYGSAIQNGFKTPDEIRRIENDTPKQGNADKLFIQGATVPLDTQNGEVNNGQ